MTAEALRAEAATGPAFAAFFGLLCLSDLKGDTGRAVAGRAATTGLLRREGRPNERRDRAALAGLCPSVTREVSTEEGRLSE